MDQRQGPGKMSQTPNASQEILKKQSLSVTEGLGPGRFSIIVKKWAGPSYAWVVSEDPNKPQVTAVGDTTSYGLVESRPN